MITFDIIRGHKLILWSERLGFKPDFVKQLDKFGTHYVQQVELMDYDKYSLIVYTKLKEDDKPFPIIFNCTSLELDSLVEKVQVTGGII